MAVKPIPEGYHTITPYLILKDVGGFLDFLQKGLGAQIVERMENPASPGEVWHAAVKIGDSHLMMGAATDKYPPQPAGLYLYVEDTDALYRRALDAGATTVMEPEDHFYGDRSAWVRDAWGNNWYISTHVEDVPPEELARRAEEQAKKRG